MPLITIPLFASTLNNSLCRVYEIVYVIFSTISR